MAVDQHCPVLQIVGYQNSGKTTLVEKLIEAASADGMEIATIKHHGHGGKPDTEITSKDSRRHRLAGASFTVVEGQGVLQMEGVRSKWSLENLIELYQYFQPDVILVEGYKAEDYPKVVLLRDSEDLSLLEKVTNVLCAVVWTPVGIENVKTFPIEAQEQYIKYILDTMRD
ncbi:molybdopterin-guanine dinucleotide biosynthesis protein B [Bacillus sp. FJAT-44742]|uniref:molybdopterin-guanine dinucleotide biosynthesis protein B n=1 Tax=Bacillus sp. FJAT-44742 TaxID=2014005 RepID=UPI000C235D2E|nr:molybdopterin-guanine dinucleotide biosynthesis protein B [Bacillus sp. FJAT-44742]